MSRPGKEWWNGVLSKSDEVVQIFWDVLRVFLRDLCSEIRKYGWKAIHGNQKVHGKQYICMYIVCHVFIYIVVSRLECELIVGIENTKQIKHNKDSRPNNILYSTHKYANATI